MNARSRVIVLLIAQWRTTANACQEAGFDTEAAMYRRCADDLQERAFYGEPPNVQRALEADTNRMRERKARQQVNA